MDHVSELGNWDDVDGADLSTLAHRLVYNDDGSCNILDEKGNVIGFMVSLPRSSVTSEPQTKGESG